MIRAARARKTIAATLTPPGPTPAALPSVRHELLVQILRDHPQVVGELLRRARGSVADVDDELLAVPSSISELQPAEFRADLVLRRRGATGGALVVEVQLRVDEDKRFSWPLYVAGLRERLRRPVTLVVLTLDEDNRAMVCDADRAR